MQFLTIMSMAKVRNSEVTNDTFLRETRNVLTKTARGGSGGGRGGGAGGGGGGFGGGGGCDSVLVCITLDLFRRKVSQNHKSKIVFVCCIFLSFKSRPTVICTKFFSTTKDLHCPQVYLYDAIQSTLQTTKSRFP